MFSSSHSSTERIHIFQLNCHKSQLPQVYVNSKMQAHSSSISLLQEVNYDSSKNQCTGFSNSFSTYASGSKPRAAIVYTKSLSSNILPLPVYTNRDMASILVCDPLSVKSKVILCSLYWSHDSDLIPDSLRALSAFAKAHSIPLLVGMDANAHNPHWGSSDLNDRGSTLEDFLASSSLAIANIGAVPTFQTLTRSEVLDISVVSLLNRNMIVNWKVTQFVSHSDHNIISFDLLFKHKVVSSFRNIRKTNWETFFAYLDSKAFLIESLTSVLDIDERLDRLNTILSMAIEKSCEVTFIRKHGPVSWWNHNLAKQRLKVTWNKKKAFRRKTNVSVRAFKALQTRYKQSCQRERRISQRKFASSLTIASFPSVYKSLVKMSCIGIPSLKKSNGTFTVDHQDTLDSILSASTSSRPCSPPLPSQFRRHDTDSTGSHDEEIINSILNPSVINDFVSKMDDYKSPGPDSIYGHMIKSAWPLIESVVCSIFRDSLLLSRIPNAWLFSRACLIPKESNPSSPGAFRIINLSCNLLKVLENSILSYWQDVCQISHSNIQFGFQLGLGTDAALNSLCAKIENASSRKNLLLAISLDLKGAFDNISFSAIDDALNSSSSPSLLNSWIAFYIRHRFVHFRLGVAYSLRLILKGCPQGGILSPFLFNLVVDRLLRHLHTLSPEAQQAYADDLIATLEFSVNEVNLMQPRAQQILDTITSWCNSAGLSINTSKTKVVLFTRKRNVVLPPLFIYGSPLVLSPSLKYLGVTFDSKLTFREHLEKIVKSAHLKLGSLNRLIGCNWGLKPSLASWAFTSIIRPATLHGCISWNKIIKKKCYMKALKKLDNRHLRLVCRSMKSAPSYTNYVLTGVSPIDFQIFSSAVISLYRLAAAGMLISSSSLVPIIQRMGSLQLPSPGSVDLIRTTSNRLTHFDIHIDHILHDRLLKSADFDQNTHPFTLNVFTDGSKSPEHCGAGFVIFRANQPPIHGKIFLASHNSVFQSETVAIYQSVHLILEYSLHLGISSINIFSDSQAALTSFSNRVVKTITTSECVGALNRLGSQCKVNLFWVQGHVGVKGNETADLLAKSLPCEIVNKFQNLHIFYLSVLPPLSLVKSSLREAKVQFIIDQINRSNSTNPLRLYVSALASSSSLPKWALNLSHGSLRLLSQCLSGHAPLNNMLAKFDPRVSPLCPSCLMEPENNIHFLGRCPAFRDVRRQTLGYNFLSVHDMIRVDVCKILDFIIMSNRFGLDTLY